MKPSKYIKKAKGNYGGFRNPWVCIFSNGEGEYVTWSFRNYFQARDFYLCSNIEALANSGFGATTDIEYMKKVGLI